MTKRRIELSLLNVLFCLIVIMIHILSYPVSQLDVGTAEYTAVMLLWRLMSFVVQGFVLLSGLKMFLTKKDRIKATSSAPELAEKRYRGGSDDTANGRNKQKSAGK